MAIVPQGQGSMQQWTISIFDFPVQDTDAAFMMKVELEAKLNGLSDEIEFLRQIYDAVRTLFPFPVAHKWIICNILNTKSICKMIS